jgi:hypothetical protein
MITNAGNTTGIAKYHNGGVQVSATATTLDAATEPLSLPNTVQIAKNATTRTTHNPTARVLFDDGNFVPASGTCSGRKGLSASIGAILHE